MAKTKNPNPQESKKSKKKIKLSEDDKRQARERNRDRMRAKRNEMRNDPERCAIQKAKERKRYHQRVAAGKIKMIDELTSREQRGKRKLWRESTRKSRQEKKEREEMLRDATQFTPPNSPFLNQAFSSQDETYQSPSTANNDQQNLFSSHQKLSGQKKARKNRRNLVKKISDLMQENNKLGEKIKKLKSGKERYKKRYLRLKRNTVENVNITPKKKIRNLMKSEKVRSKKIQRELLFGEVIKSQVQENFTSRNSHRERIELLRCISGKIIKKYRMLKPVMSLTSRRITLTAQKPPVREKQREVITLKTRKRVQEFLEKDENSCLCAGKKECITRKKVKKQKRYICSNLLELYNKFKNSDECIDMSYSTFCKIRPFWIMPPPKKRETCLCIQHENMQLLVSKLKHLNIIEERTSTDVLRSLCCPSKSAELEVPQVMSEKDSQTEFQVVPATSTFESSCLQRSCVQCNVKQIKYNLEASEHNDDVLCEKWVTKKEKVIIKGEEKAITKTVKDNIKMTKRELLDALNLSVIPFMNHVNNIRHQHLKTEEIKKNLSMDEALIHCDFSENYQMKYHREVQSAHFGASKGQLSLHTVIVYYCLKEDEPVKPISFCTVSENLRHDAAAICIHLEPIINAVKEKVPNLKTVHFLSDSPSTQYRNKKMFFFMATYLSKTLAVDFLNWHYTESGHGKGAPDGVGGYLKRTADGLVTRSEDLTSSKKFLSAMNHHCPNVTVLPVDENKIEILDQTVPKNVPQLKGTMKVHQIAWRKSEKDMLEGRRLSCLTCKLQELCSHFHIGRLNLSYARSLSHKQRLHYSDVYDSLSEDEEACTNFQESSTSEHIKITKEMIANKFVIVQFQSKKNLRHYIGLVTNIDCSVMDCEVKFLKKKSGSLKEFCFPEKDDISLVELRDIVKILHNPLINRRQNYVFDADFSFFKNIF